MATTITEVEVHGPAEAQAASRSQVYQLLASAFYFPTPETFEDTKIGNIWDRLRALSPGLPFAFTAEAISASAPVQDFKEFQSQFIGLFEVGRGSAPPCPLYEGNYWGGRTAVMAELLAFYHYFGLRPSQEQPRDLPDHLSLELEFMHALTFKEVKASNEGSALKPYWQAEHDFLNRHLVEFVAAIAKHVRPLQAPFFSETITATEKFCRLDLAYLAERVGK